MSEVRVPKKTGEGKDFIPEPISDEESHVAVCIGIFYLGTQRGDYNGKEYEREEIVIQWEVDEKYSKNAGEFAGKRKKISKRYTFSYAKKANLYKDLCAWFSTGYIERKKEEMAENPAALNIYMLVGQACSMTVYHQEKDDRTYARVDSIQKLPKGTKVFKPSELIDDNGPDVPEWIQELKKKAVDQEEMDEPVKKTTKKGKPQIEEEVDDDDEDDDPLGGGKANTVLEDDDLE